jgi:lipopolysaccharide transport system ATP-binding protein
MHVVTADGLSKRFRIGEYRAGYETLRDTLAHTAKRALRLEHVDHSLEEIWALKDVSFEISQGEVVGFIGRNGAGKSTLLKVLTQITPPTEGTATIRGRVGSILEVGTGFHPELTGRENVFLNGAILGMKRREIVAKFDEIMDFSGIAKFIDTPVKRYSTGMYVRLAFAVAAHLDPDVLIIDEVLAVGDAEFQARCMGRIEEISSSGRTVLFVSHDMQSVSRLCDRAYWLEGGRVAASGPAETVVGEYLQGSSGSAAEWRHPDPNAPPASEDDWVRIVAARIVSEDGGTAPSIDVREGVGVEIDWWVMRDRDTAAFPKLKLMDQRGNVAFNALDVDPRWQGPTAPGRYRSTAWIPANLLNEGFFTADVAIVSLDAPRLRNHFNLASALTFHVHDPGEGDSSRGQFTGQMQGAVRPLLDWTTERVDAPATYETA